MTPKVDGIPAPRADVDAIIDLVAKVEHAQQNALPGEFMELFRKDALWTTAHGKRLTGFDAISEFTHHVLPSAINHEFTAAYEAEHILFIRPDVACVKVHQRPIRRDGEPLDLDPDLSPQDLVADHPDVVPGGPLYVLAKDEGKWRIAAAQNTKVIDPETLAAHGFGSTESSQR